jgi:hypothetical protein
LSADPNIQSPLNSQSHNRYSYVWNNPLKYTDPSGYFIKWLKKKVKRFVKKWGRTILAIAAMFIPGAPVFITGFLSGMIASGGDFRAGLIGGLTAGAFDLAGGLFKGTLSNAISHGVIGGIRSKLMGGKFADGFVGGAFGSFANPVGDGFSWAGFAIAVVAGGVGSVLGGGKFKNGAVTAAFGYMFNAAKHAQKARAQLSKEFRTSIDEARQLGADGDIDGYIDRVRSGGIWDFKSRREYRNLEGIEDFGNFAFGATGAAWADGYTGGLSNQSPERTTNLLMRGAGAYQEFFQSYNPSDGHFYDFSPPAESNYGDQFRDQINIYSGAQYYFRRRAGE